VELLPHLHAKVVVWTDRVKSEEMLYRFKEERSVLSTTKRSQTNWNGCMSYRNRLLKHIIEGQKGREVNVEGVSSYWLAVRIF
jgi:hypothetical protein